MAESPTTIRRNEGALKQEAQDKRLRTLEYDLGQYHQAVLRSDYAAMDGEHAFVTRDGKRKKVQYDNDSFTTEERDEFMRSWLAQRKTEILRAKGYDVPAKVELPPSKEGASLEEIQKRNEHLIRTRAEVQKKIIDLEEWEDFSEDAERLNVEQRRLKQEVVEARLDAQIEEKKELEAKFERAEELGPEGLEKHNRRFRNKIALLETSLNSTRLILQKQQEDRPWEPVEPLKKKLIEYAVEIEIAQRQLLPEHKPVHLEENTVITNELWNDMVNDSNINGANDNNLVQRLAYAADKIHEERVMQEFWPEVVAHSEHADTTWGMATDTPVSEFTPDEMEAMLETHDLMAPPIDKADELLARAATGAMDARYGNFRIEPLPDPQPLGLEWVEKEPATPQDEEYRKKRLAELHDQGYVPVNAELAERRAKEAAKAAEQTPEELRYENVPAVEDPIELPETLGERVAEEVWEVYEDQQEAPKTIWEKVKGAAATAVKPVPWLRARSRGLFTAGITSWSRAVAFSGVTRELGIKVQELEEDAYVNVNRQFLDAKGDMPPPEVAKYLQERLDKNEKIVDEIVATVKKRMEEEFGTYTRSVFGKKLKLFGRELRVRQYTSEVMANDIVTPEKWDAFEADLRELLRKEQTSMAIITSSEYTKLIRNHFDPSWWKNYFYASIETTAALATGVGIIGLVYKGTEALLGQGATEAGAAAAGNLQMEAAQAGMDAANLGAETSKATLDAANFGLDTPSSTNIGIESFDAVPEYGAGAATEVAAEGLEAAAEGTYYIGKDGLHTAAAQMAERAGLTPGTTEYLEAVQEMQIAGEPHLAGQWGVGVRRTIEEAGFAGDMLRPTEADVLPEVWEKLILPNADKGWLEDLGGATVPDSTEQVMLDVLEKHMTAA